MTVELGICLLVGIAAAVTDCRYRKVRNALVIPVFLAGLIRALAASGGPGPLDALAGSAIPLFLFPFFALRMLGAGDIKLLMAMGVWLGYHDSITLMILAILSGGVLALGIMAVRRNGRRRLKKLHVYLVGCLLAGGLFPYEDFGRMEKDAALPFALPVLMGVFFLWGQRAGVVPLLI